MKSKIENKALSFTGIIILLILISFSSTSLVLAMPGMSGKHDASGSKDMKITSDDVSEDDNETSIENASKKIEIRLNESQQKLLNQLIVMDTEELYSSYVDMKSLEVLKLDEMLNKIEPYRIIYVGENHTNRAHHNLQKTILEHISDINPNTALAMEFFYRSDQRTIDDYMAGKVSDEDFSYIARKGFGSWYGDFYSPLVLTAKDRKLKLLGINVEKDVKRKMADNGWESLSESEKLLIPEDIDLSNKEHHRFVMSQFGALSASGKAGGMFHNNKMMDRMYLLQTMWDETFADAIARYLKGVDSIKLKDDSMQNSNDTQVVVILGSAHVSYRVTVPNRSFKRYPASHVILVPVTVEEMNEDTEEDFKALITSDIADIVYFSSSISN